MAAIRRGQGPMKLEVPNPVLGTDLPLISALFLIYFDIKAGYTISWKRSLSGIELEGVVEYKSLPSGLHTVKEDLIYFVHERHAGLSAFVNAPASEESRNARMIAVGILVPLSYGRLGRSWKHADNLKDLAQELVSEPTETKALEDYWELHRAQNHERQISSENYLDSPSSIQFKPAKQQLRQLHKHTRNRSASDGTALLPPEHNLSAHHPAWSLSILLDTFGPLIFPMYRMALLRKRILISCHAPVQETCDFVYDLSVISNIPLAVSDLLSASAPPQRLRPLFTIGVHDIPLLEEDLRAATAPAVTPELGDEDEAAEDIGQGWIACTTDGILAMKGTLYDVLVTMPQVHSAKVQGKDWPLIESPRDVGIKATQRDLRRYRTLRWGLSRSRSRSVSPDVRRTSTEQSSNLGLHRTLSSTTLVKDSPMLNMPDTDNIVEPLSWTALAYSGFMWWASAGERSVALDEETESDSALLSGLDMDTQSPSSSRHRSILGNTTAIPPPDSAAKKEMTIIAYFHRLTTLIFTTISNIIDATDSDDEDETPLRSESSGGNEDGPAVFISRADITMMGLDEWSASDHSFVEDLVKAYFGRRAKIESRNVDVCGVRVC